MRQDARGESPALFSQAGLEDSAAEQPVEANAEQEAAAADEAAPEYEPEEQAAEVETTPAAQEIGEETDQPTEPPPAPVSAGAASFPRASAPEGPDWEGAGGEPPGGPEPPDAGWSGNGRSTRYLLYTGVAGLTLFAAYLGLAVGDSLQDGAASLPALPTPDASLRAQVCSTVPVRMDSGTSLNLSFAGLADGQAISEVFVLATSSGASIENVITVVQSGQSILFVARFLPDSAGRSDQYQVNVTFAQGNQTSTAQCTVIVQGIAASQPTVPPVASATATIAVVEPTSPIIILPPNTPIPELDTPTPPPTSTPTVTGTPPTPTPTMIPTRTPTPVNTPVLSPTPSMTPTQLSTQTATPGP